MLRSFPATASSGCLFLILAVFSSNVEQDFNTTLLDAWLLLFIGVHSQYNLLWCCGRCIKITNVRGLFENILSGLRGTEHKQCSSLALRNKCLPTFYSIHFTSNPQYSTKHQLWPSCPLNLEKTDSLPVGLCFWSLNDDLNRPPPPKTSYKPENIPLWFLESINLDHLKHFVSFVNNY